MVAVYNLRLQIITSVFLEIGKLNATDFVVLDQRITINALRMMLDILFLSYLFCKKD